jgi:hypothetical protein
MHPHWLPDCRCSSGAALLLFVLHQLKHHEPAGPAPFEKDTEVAFKRTTTSLEVES